MKQIIVFTDLDGTLLNHEDYLFEDALPAVNKLKEKDIPIIITTSKTRKEVEIIQKQLRIKDPFITENGGGIFFRKGYRNFQLKGCKNIESYCLIQLGIEYEKIVEFEKRIKNRFHIKGFFEMSVEEVAQLTGLPIEMAKLAKEREFTEPFLLFNPEELPELEREAQKHGIKITKGGRFYHFIGKNQDKGKAVKLTTEIFKENLKKDIISIGLGDSKNDIPMLETVDIPVLIMKPDGSYEDFERKNLIKSRYPGSKGWNQAILELLNELH